MSDPTKPPVDDAAGDSVIEQRSRELFDDKVAGLDGRTRSRLNQARQAALAVARGEARSHSLSSRWLLPVGSAAALALVTLSVQHMHTKQEDAPSAAMAVSSVDDEEILASSEELDMLQNVDFYAWLDTQQDGIEAQHSTSEAG